MLKQSFTHVKESFLCVLKQHMVSRGPTCNLYIFIF